MRNSQSTAHQISAAVSETIPKIQSQRSFHKKTLQKATKLWNDALLQNVTGQIYSVRDNSASGLNLMSGII